MQNEPNSVRRTPPQLWRWGSGEPRICGRTQFYFSVSRPTSVMRRLSIPVRQERQAFWREGFRAIGAVQMVLVEGQFEDKLQ
jgi:hypothetical protein